MAWLILEYVPGLIMPPGVPYPSHYWQAYHVTFRRDVTNIHWKGARSSDKAGAVQELRAEQKRCWLVGDGVSGE